MKSDSRSTRDLLSMARDTGPCLGFARALAGRGLSIIAEIKRRSPSKGDLNLSLDPASQAKVYEFHGASCVSVLTDGKYFGGSLQDLKVVRSNVRIPILRKDFTVCTNDVLDAKLNGADAVLLIVAALSQGELEEFLGVAKEVGLDSLVEVHDREELERAKAAGAELVGVNQRDLFTFEVDSGRAAALAIDISESAVKVCESGISSSIQIRSLAEAGYDAALIGETLVRSMDPGRTLSELLAAGRSER